MLCEATGVCGGERCPDFTVPPPPNGKPGVPPPAAGKKGLPWWFWAIMGTAAAGILGYTGYQVYKDYKAKRRVRGGAAPALGGGYDITPVEMGEGYDGYGKPESDDGLKVTLRVPRGGTKDAAARALAHLPVADVAIEEPPVEEIIREVFRHGGSHA